MSFRSFSNLRVVDRRLTEPIRDRIAANAAIHPVKHADTLGAYRICSAESRAFCSSSLPRPAADMVFRDIHVWV
jgi:hypothetical protein